MHFYTKLPATLVTALGRPGSGGRKVAVVENTRFEPGFQLSAAPRGCLHLRQECLMVDPIEAFCDIQFERILRSKPDGGKNGSDGIMAGPSWAKAIGVRRQFGFPFGFQGLAYYCLPCPVRLGRNAQWALFRP